MMEERLIETAGTELKNIGYLELEVDLWHVGRDKALAKEKWIILGIN